MRLPGHRAPWQPLSHQFHHQPAELLPGEGVNDGVEAAVGESNGLCPLHGQREMMHLVAIQEVPLSLQHVEKDDNVVGGPEEEKGDDNDKDIPNYNPHTQKR